jgi:hypothetical protein
LIERAFAIGAPTLAWNAEAARTLQRFVLCRERGGLAQYLVEVRDREDLFPSPLVHRSVLAHALAHEDRPEEAAVFVREIMGHDLADWHVDEQWFVSLCLLAETCGLIGDPEPAPVLYALLEPYAAHNAVAVPELALDCTGRPLGLLAALLGRFEDAERHFSDAIAMNERMGAPVWAEHTRRARAAILH